LRVCVLPISLDILPFLKMTPARAQKLTKDRVIIGVLLSSGLGWCPVVLLFLGSEWDGDGSLMNWLTLASLCISHGTYKVNRHSLVSLFVWEPEGLKLLTWHIWRVSSCASLSGKCNETNEEVIHRQARFHNGAKWGLALQFKLYPPQF
jgi:hypothetical protein